ncbi:hypothetical protein WMO79_01700 [Micrococcaceae bacterium Sec7.4]
MSTMTPVQTLAAEGKNSLSVRAGIIESGIPMPMLAEMTDVEISAKASNAAMTWLAERSRRQFVFVLAVLVVCLCNGLVSVPG